MTPCILRVWKPTISKLVIEIIVNKFVELLRFNLIVSIFAYMDAHKLSLVICFDNVILQQAQFQLYCS